MSSTNSRPRILEAALGLITKRGAANVTMAEIARAARVSRQGVYLHFPDRADLLIALVRHLDDKLNLQEDIQRLERASSSRRALAGVVAMQARRNPALWAVARAFEAVRRTDPAAENSWQDRLTHRLRGCRRLIARLKREGQLRKGLDQRLAADLLWSLTSLRTWEDLVLQRGWTPARYRRWVTRILLETLTRSR